MKLTEQQLFEYIFCPARYDIKFNKKIDIEEHISMPILLNKVSRYFFVNLLNGKIPSIQELKSKWDSICTANLERVDAKTNIEGWGLIINMINWASRNKIVVLDMDTMYNISIGDVELSGQMGTILAAGNNKMELFVPNFSNKTPDQTEVDMKLKYTVDMYAFEKTYNRELQGIHIKTFKNDKDLYSYRTHPDFIRLEDTITGVANGIKANAFYPRENVLCGSCRAREYCKYWQRTI